MESWVAAFFGPALNMLRSSTRHLRWSMILARSSCSFWRSVTYEVPAVILYEFLHQRKQRISADRIEAAGWLEKLFQRLQCLLAPISAALHCFKGQRDTLIAFNDDALQVLKR